MSAFSKWPTIYHLPPFTLPLTAWPAASPFTNSNLSCLEKLAKHHTEQSSSLRSWCLSSTGVDLVFIRTWCIYLVKMSCLYFLLPHFCLWRTSSLVSSHFYSNSFQKVTNDFPVSIINGPISSPPPATHLSSLCHLLRHFLSSRNALTPWILWHWVSFFFLTPTFGDLSPNLAAVALILHGLGLCLGFSHHCTLISFKSLPTAHQTWPTEITTHPKLIHGLLCKAARSSQTS